MGFFDAPAIAIRKRVSAANHHLFNAVEVYSQSLLNQEREQHQPYQLGIVLAAWVKAGIMAGEIAMANRDAQKIQAISDSCVRTLKNESYSAFRVLTSLAEQDGIFGVPATVFERISFDAAAYR